MTARDFAPAPVIDATGVAKSYGTRLLLSGVSLTIRGGEHVGLVGNNGSGKSTLGRILAGVETADDGQLARRRGARIDYLAQEPQLPAGQSVREVVLASLASWSDARRRFEAATARLGGLHGAELEAGLREQATATDEIERLGGWERLHEAETVIGHLGLGDPGRRVETLSGGERRRVALARLLVGAPDLAILDEPTNHLDIDTIEWLEEHLATRFSGALLLITHDRHVLDRVTTRTLELEAGQLASYVGGYAAYLEGKAERLAHAERSERNRQNLLRRELEWLRRQPKARGTKQKARILRAEEAMSRSAPRSEQTADLRVHAERLGKTVLELAGLRIEREGRVLVQGLDLALSAGQRIGVVGPNGSGKTSLLLCLLGQLEPAAGRVGLGLNTRIGYLDQVRGRLDDGQSVRECVADDQSEVEIGGERLQVGAYLERFLFDRRAQRIAVGELSGGERARVCLARLLWQKTNLLLLDEPTNDLDVATLGALEAMLEGYAGSALIVSHDRWFLDRVATAILAFEGDGRVELHAGGWSDYRERVGARARSPEPEPTSQPTPAAPTAKTDPKPARPRRLSAKEERELAGLFDAIAEAEAEAESIEARLADPRTYRQQPDGAAVAALREALAAARERTALLTARWEELEARKAATT